MLAAIRIQFVHPMSKEQIIIDCSPEHSFIRVIELLRQQAASR
jgi:hypothetical protein